MRSARIFCDGCVSCARRRVKSVQSSRSMTCRDKNLMSLSKLRLENRSVEPQRTKGELQIPSPVASISTLCPVEL